MFDSYSEIYEDRGHSYHAAMERFPRARAEEFRRLVDYAEPLGESAMVVDVPAGGGYLRPFLSPGVSLIDVDPARSFLHAGRHLGADRVVCAAYDALPFDEGSIDVVFSLAGLHHVEEHVAVFHEWHRVLRLDGIAVIGDVYRGTATECFLEDVVDRFNRMGHRGRYLSLCFIRVRKRGCRDTAMKND